MSYKIWLASSLVFSGAAFAQVQCPEVITQAGVLVSPKKEEMPSQYFLGVDGNDMGHQVVETKEYQEYRNVDDLTVTCLQGANASPYSRIIYEQKIIVIYTLYPNAVDYVILVPQKGSDDIVHYQSTRKDYNVRLDTLLFKKRSMFEDLNQIIASRYPSTP